MKQTKTIACLFLVASMLTPIVQAAEFRLVCESWFRPNTTVAPGNKQWIHLDIIIPDGSVPEIGLPRDEVRAMHRDFIVSMSNDRGSVWLDIIDVKTNKQLQRFLWQFWDVPANTFQSSGQGFTGLIYINHPETRAELQIICEAK